MAKEKITADGVETNADETVSMSKLDLQELIAREIAKAMESKKDEVPNVVDKEVSENETYMQEKVPVKLFVDNDKYKEDVVVCVNGKAYVIKRGVEVLVPRFVKEVIDNSMSQDGNTARMLQGLANEFESRFLEVNRGDN